MPENGDVERVGRDGGGETDDAGGKRGSSCAVSAIYHTSMSTMLPKGPTIIKASTKLFELT